MQVVKLLFQERPHLSDKVCVVSFWPWLLYKVCLGRLAKFLALHVVYIAGMCIILHSGSEDGLQHHVWSDTAE